MGNRPEPPPTDGREAKPLAPSPRAPKGFRKPSSLRRLSFKIASAIVADHENLTLGEWATEDLAQTIYELLPETQAQALEEMEQVDRWLNDDSDERPMPQKPSVFSTLREAVHATPEMTILTVIEAAVKVIQKPPLTADDPRVQRIARALTGVCSGRAGRDEAGIGERYHALREQRPCESPNQCELIAFSEFIVGVLMGTLT